MQSVRPILEYSVQAWSSWLQSDIDLLENVQRGAGKAVSGLKGSYEDKHSSMNMLSLQQRRLHGDMIETIKLVHDIEDIAPSKLFTIASNYHNHATRNSTVVTENIAAPSYGLIKEPSKLELRSNFFLQRILSQ